MRLPRVVVALALAGVAGIAPDAESKETQETPPSWDLLSRGLRLRGTGDWATWWAVNRARILKPSYRASSGPAAPAADAAARTRARDALLAELKSKDGLVASEAALALGRAGDVRDILTLSKLVSEGAQGKSRRVHSLAAYGLGLLPKGDTDQSAMARNALLEGVTSACGEKDRLIWYWSGCAAALVLRNDIGALPRIVELRRDARGGDLRRSLNGEILGVLCFAATALGGEDSMPEIDAQLHGRRPPDSGNKDGSWAACWSLTRLPGEPARKLLRVAAKDDREVLRRNALAALGAVCNAQDEDTAALLRETFLNDTDALSRQAAAIALARTGHASAAPTLIKSIQHRPARVRGRDAEILFDRPTVALAIGLLARGKPDPDLTGVLTRALAATHTQDEQAALCIACGLAGAQTERARIAELMDHGKGDVLAASAAHALSLTGAGPAELKLLHEAVAQSTFPDLRGEAALTLGVLRDHTVVDQLRAIVDNKRTKDVDRSTAAVCLGYVGDDRDIDFLVGAIDASGADGQVRACMVHALGRLLDRTENAALGGVVAESMWFKDPRDTAPDVISDLQHMAD